MIGAAFHKLNRRQRARFAAAFSRFSLSDDDLDETSEQEMKECPRCKGNGVIVLLISRRKCEKCGGSGRVPVGTQDD